MFFRALSTVYHNDGQATSMLGRLQGRQLAVLLFEGFAHRAGRPLADACIAALFQEAAQTHQMVSIRARAALFGMLQAKSVYRQQVNGSKGGVGILARADFVKDSAAILQAVRQQPTAHRTDTRAHDSRLSPNTPYTASGRLK
jgi:hypothetical protein